MAHNAPAPNETLDVHGVIFSHQDLFDVVDDFYTRIQKDDLLSIPFQSVHDWPEHIERLTHFWWIRFGGRPYLISDYNPVLKHFFAGFNETLLKRWLSLFHQTLSDHLSPEQVQMWSMISSRMGQALNMKNEMFKQHHQEAQKKNED